MAESCKRAAESLDNSEESCEKVVKPNSTAANGETSTKTTIDPPAACPYELGEKTELFSGKFLSAEQVTFRNPINNESGIWQIAHRATRLPGNDIDGITVVPIMKRAGKKYFVIIKEFRIPVHQWVLQFPAGLVDVAAESLETCAIRELKEETGYTVDKVIGTTQCVSPLDAGISSFSGKALIDGDKPENLNPSQQLQCGEFIEVITVPCEELVKTLGDYGRQGYMVEYALYLFAIGQALQRNMESLDL